MATYAAYRHIELDNVGYGKKRVLKPPGGGSSDIFGGPDDATSPRRVKNHNASQLTGFFGDNAPKNGTSTGTTSPESPRGNKPDGNPVTGTGYTPDQQNNVAPIQNGSVSNMNGSDKSNDVSPAGSTKGSGQSRARVPPGGYSSGLW